MSRHPELPRHVGIDGNDIWECLFSIMKGDVPDELTDEVLAELARSLNQILRSK